MCNGHPSWHSSCCPRINHRFEGELCSRLSLTRVAFGGQGRKGASEDESHLSLGFLPPMRFFEAEIERGEQSKREIASIPRPIVHRVSLIAALGGVRKCQTQQRRTSVERAFGLTRLLPDWIHPIYLSLNLANIFFR